MCAFLYLLTLTSICLMVIPCSSFLSLDCNLAVKTLILQRGLCSCTAELFKTYIRFIFSTVAAQNSVVCYSRKISKKYQYFVIKDDQLWEDPIVEGLGRTPHGRIHLEQQVTESAPCQLDRVS